MQDKQPLVTVRNGGEGTHGHTLVTDPIRDDAEFAEVLARVNAGCDELEAAVERRKTTLRPGTTATAHTSAWISLRPGTTARCDYRPSWRSH